MSRARLVARSAPWTGPGAVDPIALAGANGCLFGRGDTWLAGVGEAAVVEIPAASGRAGADADRADPAGAARLVAATLAAVDHSTAGPRNVCALGGVDFDGAGRLVVPRLTVRFGPDGVTVTVVDDGTGPGPDDALAALAPTSSPAPALEPSTFEVTSSIAPERWCDAVAEATRRIRAGDARKVVLARELRVAADRPFLRQAVLERLRTTYPGCMVFATAPTATGSSFVGASPELLVARDGPLVRSHPLAGTAARHGDPAADAARADELVASAKDRAEHRVTIDMVHDTLLPFCSYLDEEAEPSVVPVANVFHLGTMVEGKLSEPPPSVVELVLTLHPTPAVGGWPVAAARALIAELEGGDRGAYAGPVGWVDAEGNGEWAVGIRSAELTGSRARLFAGVGVVADSDPASELVETRAKFQAMLAALVRP